MLILLSAIIMASATPLVSKLDKISEQPGSWERWAFDVTNTTNVSRDIRICPQDVTMILHDPAASKTRAFALAFDRDTWSYECIQTTVAAGQVVSFKAYIPPFGRAGETRTVTIKTTDGDYITPLS